MKKIIYIILLLFASCKEKKIISGGGLANGTIMYADTSYVIKERYFMVGYLMVNKKLNYHHGQYFFSTLDGTFPDYNEAKRATYDFIGDKKFNIKSLSILSITEFKNQAEFLKWKP